MCSSLGRAVDRLLPIDAASVSFPRVSYLAAHGLIPLLSSLSWKPSSPPSYRVSQTDTIYKALLLFETIEKISHDSRHRDVFVRVIADTMMQLPSRVDTDVLEGLLYAIEETTPISLLSAFEGLLNDVVHIISEQTDGQINLHDKEV
jgi:hypothetical protein